MIPLFTVTPPFVNVEEPDTIRLSFAVSVPILTVNGPLKFEDPVTDNAGWRSFPLSIVTAVVVLSTPSYGKFTIKDPVDTVKDDDCTTVEPDNIVFPIFLKLPDIIADPVYGNVPPITDKAKDAVTAFWAKDELIEFWTNEAVDAKDELIAFKTYDAVKAFSTYEAVKAYEADVADVATVAVVAVVAEPAVVAELAVFAFSAYVEYEDVIAYDELTDCEELTAFKTYDAVFANEALKVLFVYEDVTAYEALVEFKANEELIELEANEELNELVAKDAVDEFKAKSAINAFTVKEAVDAKNAFWANVEYDELTAFKTYEAVLANEALTAFRTYEAVKAYEALKAFVACDAEVELEAYDELNELEENVDAGELSANEAVIAFWTNEAVAAYELETAFKIYEAVTALLAHEAVPVNGPTNEGAVIEFKAVVEPDMISGPDFKSIVPHNVCLSPPLAPSRFEPEVNAVEDVIIWEKTILAVPVTNMLEAVIFNPLATVEANEELIAFST